MKRGARFFYIMGTLVILLAIWWFLETPLDVTDWFYVLNFLVWLSVGITEIAVGYLIEKQMK